MLTQGKAKGWLVALGTEAKAGEGKVQEGERRGSLGSPERFNPSLPRKTRVLASRPSLTSPRKPNVAPALLHPPRLTSVLRWGRLVSAHILEPSLSPPPS